MSHLACWYPSLTGLLHNPGNTCTTRRVWLYSGMNHSQELDTIPGNSYQILGNACITLHIALCLVPGIAFLVLTFPGMTVTMLGIRSQELVKMCRFPGNVRKTQPIQKFVSETRSQDLVVFLGIRPKFLGISSPNHTLKIALSKSFPGFIHIVLNSWEFLHIPGNAVHLCNYPTCCSQE